MLTRLSVLVLVMTMSLLNIARCLHFCLLLFKIVVTDSVTVPNF